MRNFKLPDGLSVFERGWLSSNCILFDDSHSSWLVDSGYCTHSTQTLDLVASQLGLRPLNMLINTHLHSDHCGGNAALQAQYPDLVTVIPPGQSSLVRAWDPVGLFYTPTGQLCPRFKFDQTLVQGSVIQLGLHEWEVHAAGGHDPHAVIFFEPKARVLISADALWQSGFGVIFPELEGIKAFADVASTL
ncbi:MAG: MBL fold metallo-hydrolase, partial [Polaromonas sp.]|nr:MBL fold metallo-hydrolase [Polaromonas sp.]